MTQTEPLVLNEVLSIFTKYPLSEADTLQGQILSPLQRMCVQNLIAQCAEDKVMLKFDATKPTEFAQQEAEIQGQLGMLTYLLEQSKQAEQHLKELKTNQDFETNGE